MVDISKRNWIFFMAILIVLVFLTHSDFIRPATVEKVVYHEDPGIKVIRFSPGPELVIPKYEYFRDSSLSAIMRDEFWMKKGEIRDSEKGSLFGLSASNEWAEPLKKKLISPLP